MSISRDLSFPYSLPSLPQPQNLVMTKVSTDQSAQNTAAFVSGVALSTKRCNQPYHTLTQHSRAVVHCLGYSEGLIAAELHKYLDVPLVPLYLGTYSPLFTDAQQHYQISDPLQFRIHAC
jgi:hypothetical protein